MLQSAPLHKIFFLDIETVPQQEFFESNTSDMQKLWESKAQKAYPDFDSAANVYEDKAGIFAEFGKIICISIGIFHLHNKEWKFRVKSYFGHDEKDILNRISELLKLNNDKILCAHNGKEFDFPYLCRRMLIQRVKIPKILNFSGKKPWEIPHFDTMELWKFGDYKNFTSLNLLAQVLEIPTPKDDIDGSQVAQVYHKEKNLEKIVAYCQKDVITTARIFQRLKEMEPVADHQIEIIGT